MNLKGKKIIPNGQDYTIDPKSPDPLYHQLKELIKRQIGNNSVLVEEGVLYRRQGRGTFVARPDFKRSFIRFFRYGLGEQNHGDFPESKVLNSEIIVPPKRVQKILQLKDNKRTIKITRIRSIGDTPLMLEDLFLPHHIFKGFDRVDISQQLLYPI